MVLWNWCYFIERSYFEFIYDNWYHILVSLAVKLGSWLTFNIFVIVGPIWLKYPTVTTNRVPVVVCKFCKLWIVYLWFIVLSLFWPFELWIWILSGVGFHSNNFTLSYVSHLEFGCLKKTLHFGFVFISWIASF